MSEKWKDLYVNKNRLKTIKVCVNKIGLAGWLPACSFDVCASAVFMAISLSATSEQFQQWNGGTTNMVPKNEPRTYISHYYLFTKWIWATLLSKNIIMKASSFFFFWRKREGSRAPVNIIKFSFFSCFFFFALYINIHIFTVHYKSK